MIDSKQSQVLGHPLSTGAYFHDGIPWLTSRLSSRRLIATMFRAI